MKLVVRATGMLGNEICRQLAAVGKPVRALVRATSDPAKVEVLKGYGAEIVEGDRRDATSLAGARTRLRGGGATMAHRLRPLAQLVRMLVIVSMLVASIPAWSSVASAAQLESTQEGTAKLQVPPAPELQALPAPELRAPPAPEPMPQETSRSSDLSVPAPEMSLSSLLLSLDAEPDVADPGDLVVYTLTLTNTGDLPLTALLVNAVFVPELIYEPAATGSEPVGQYYSKSRTLRYTLDRLRAGEARVLTIQAHLSKDATGDVPCSVFVGKDPAQAPSATAIVRVRGAVYTAAGTSAGPGLDVGWKLLYNAPVVSPFSGSATYSYELATPPGRKGIQPQVSLSYSSRAVDGTTNWVDSEWVGMGWSIDTIDIARRDVWYTWGAQGNYEWLDLAREFSLMVNGTTYRLTPAEGVTWHGRYYAEDAPGLSVELVSGSTENLKGDYWIVRTPQGIRYRLGYKYNSEQKLWRVYCSPDTHCYSEAAPNEQVYRWRVDEVTDSFNNRMAFTYYEHSRYGRDYASYPANIYYNNYSGGWASRIEFVSSLSGVEPGQFSPILRTRRQLDRVRMVHLGQLVREYIFTYEIDVHANASVERRLTRIEQCGAAGKCMPPITFAYQDYYNKVWELGGHQDLCNLDATPKWPYDNVAQCQYWGEQFPYPRLVQVENGYGAVTALTYTDALRNGAEPEKYYAVSQSQTWDGVQHIFPDATAPKVTYDYGAPCWDSPGQGCDIPIQETNSLIGFAQTTERSREHDGAAWQTLSGIVHQFDLSNYRMMGRETQTRWLDAADSVLRQSDNVWNITPGNEGMVYQGEERLTDYSGGTRTCTRVAHTLDDYGNPIATYKYGAEEPLVNAGFERGSDGWQLFYSSTPASATMDQHFAGRGSLQLQGARSGGAYQDVAGLVPGETYVVRAWVKADPGTTAKFLFWLTDGSSRRITPTTTWSQETMTFVANSTGQVRIRLYYLPAAGTIYVDEVALARAQDVGDERSTHRFFFNLTDNNRWFIGLKWGENIYQGITPNVGGSALKMQTIWYYDDYSYDSAQWGESDQIDHGLVTMMGQGLLGAAGQPFVTSRSAYDLTYGLLTSGVNPKGDTTAITYDATYRLFTTEVCQAVGVPGVERCSQTEYYGLADPADHGLPGQVKREIDPNGVATEYRYDDFGRGTKVIRHGDSPDLPTTETAYHDGRHLWVSTKQREQSGQAGTLDSEVLYNGLGQTILARTEATNGQWIISSTRYDALGNVTQECQPQLHGTQAQVFEAESDLQHHLGSAQGGVWLSPDITANHSNPGYLSFGPYQAPGAEGPGQKACFRLAIDVVAGADPNHPVGILDVYDADAGRVLAEQKLKRGDFQGGLGNMSEFCLVFDTGGRAGHDIEYRVYWQDYAKMAHDRVTVVWYHPTAADPPCTHTQFDALGRVVQIVNADGSTSTTGYVGRTTIVLDANGHRRDAVTDAFGRQVAAHEYQDGSGTPTTTRYAYDVLGNLTQVTDAAGHVTTMTYNALSRKTQMSDPDMGQWTYEYDAAGNMVRQTDALGQTTVFVYDALQRLVSKQRADGTVLAQYSYDEFSPALGQYGRGRRTGMTDLSGSTHRTYDQRGRLTAETKSINGFGDFVTRFTYDASDRVVTITYPDGEVVVHTFDGQGLLESVARADGTYTYVENVDYNAHGQMTLIEYGAAGLNLSTEYEYNDENTQLESLVTTGPFAVLQNLAYTYDAVGNVLSVTDGMNNGQTQHFSYDALDRMEHAWTTGGGQGGFDRTYAYDAIGNITEKDGMTYYYDPNRPHAVEAVVWGTTQPGSYAYDANGNMTSRNENGTLYAMDYNFENRLASVTTGGETTTFGYDGDGSRVKRIESSGETTAYLGGFYEVSYPPPPGKLATGRVTNVGSSTWRTVVLSQTYSSMVVIAAPNYDSGDAPAVVRVRNAAGNSFQIRVQNPSDQPLSGYTVHYLVVEEGVYSLAQHGVKMEAKRYTSTATDRVGSWIGQQRSYQQSYAHPVVLGQVMTANDADWSVFWARGSVQGNPPTASYLFTGKHVGADTDTTRANETIGYLVIESGSGSIGGVAYVAAVGPDSVYGAGDSPPYNYAISGPSTAEIALVSAAAMDGGDGGWPVLYGSAPVSASQLRLAFDEDQIQDAERNHTNEEVPYIVFSGSRTLPPLGIRVKKYYHVAGRRVAMRVDDGSTEDVFFLHGDHLGSTSLVTTGNDMWAGALLVQAGREWSRQLFTPYGETRWSSGVSPSDLQFTGQRHETSLALYDFGARFYVPFLGRFVSPDPIVPEPGNPQALNRYAYALGNPQRYTDPTGFFTEEEIMKALGVSSWAEVLALFEEGSGHPLAGRWGWLEILRRAEQGDIVQGSGPAIVLPGASGPPPDETMIFIVNGEIVTGYISREGLWHYDPLTGDFYNLPEGTYRASGTHVEWATRYSWYRLPEQSRTVPEGGFETDAWTIHYHWRRRFKSEPIYMRAEDMTSMVVTGAGIVLEFTPLSPAYAAGVSAGQVVNATKNVLDDPMQISSTDVLDIAGALPIIGIPADVAGMVCTAFGWEWVYTP